VRQAEQAEDARPHGHSNERLGRNPGIAPGHGEDKRSKNSWTKVGHIGSVVQVQVQVSEARYGIEATF